MGYILSDRRLKPIHRTGAVLTRTTGNRPENADTLRYLQVAAAALDEHKAADVVVLDLRGLCDATDYFLLASGTSDTHVRALAEHVVEALDGEERRFHHAEGLKAGRWALLDYVDFVIHVFHPTLREFYSLERLWVDAPSIPVSQPIEDSSLR